MVERRLRRHLGREAGGCVGSLVFGVMDSRAPPGAVRRTNTKIPSCGRGCTLWTALDGQRVQAVEQPCRRPEDAAIAQCTGRSHPAPPVETATEERQQAERLLLIMAAVSLAARG